jgi:oligosaccharide repeat unit polymerase
MPCARSTPTGPQWLTLVSAILASGLFAFVFATDWAAFAAFTAVAVTALIVARRTLLHPYIWYTPPFFLYGAAYPILVWLGDVAPAGPLRATLLLEWLALATFVMVVGPAEARVPQLRPLASPSRTVGWLLLGAASVPCFLLVSSVQSSGLMNSRQIVSNSNLFTTYHWGFSILTFAYLVLLGDAVVRKKRLWLPAALMAVGFGWGVLSLLIAGQRADIFRVLWVSLLMMHVLSPQFRRGRVTAIALALLFLVPLGQQLKSSLVAGRGAPSTRQMGAVSEVLHSEFVSASQNLSLVIVAWADTRYYGQTLWWDLLITLQPTFLFPNNRPSSITTEFNAQLYREVLANGGGEGFTLVGEGYTNFGPLGVVLWFALIGLFVKRLYLRSARGLLAVITYVMVTPVLMFATRGDLSNIMSQCTKHVLLPVLLITFADHLLSRRERLSGHLEWPGRLPMVPFDTREPAPLRPFGTPVAGRTKPASAHMFRSQP